MSDELFERMHVKVQVGGKRVLWSAHLKEEAIDGTVFEDDVVGYDELHFETLPTTPSEDAMRLASTIEVICLSLGPDIPAKLTFDITNYNHEEWETETLQ